MASGATGARRVVDLRSDDLAMRCLALTGSFETGLAPPDCFAGIAGDFDGQGLSLGACQWNLGQGSLQQLLGEMATLHAALVDKIFGARAAEFTSMLTAPRAQQLRWARSIQDARHAIAGPWRAMFTELGRSPEFRAIQVQQAAEMFATARALSLAHGVMSERAVALMFDIRVQNGGIGETARRRIEHDYAQMPVGIDERAHLRAIANRRAEASHPRWIEDVRARKLVIANGEGVLHGRRYDLEADYRIGLRPADI
jgi:hypothetical protein